MQWTMPHRVLQVVGVLLALVALSAFTLGVVNAPSRGRMPGERPAAAGGAASVVATDAVPLSADRIEGATSPRELTAEEKEKLEADKEARQEADEEARAAAATAPPGPASASGGAAAAGPAPNETPPAPPPEEAPH
ncbi:hypothetical protein [Phenylobacterium sp.]|jgi:hypothetical protein|uniref:hypothetical protein n=1 Tax=Phenylobacterium sp. TaxID=1871053 RepID=UPI002E319E27|nr:hypothetical protein [Phenylobacterium sp.]HEX3366304.1 hypothetical protein [Phenylobacterium sp.]